MKRQSRFWDMELRKRRRLSQAEVSALPVATLAITTRDRSRT
jgi:hypothetical protein